MLGSAFNFVAVCITRDKWKWHRTNYSDTEHEIFNITSVSCTEITQAVFCEKLCHILFSNQRFKRHFKVVACSSWRRNCIARIRIAVFALSKPWTHVRTRTHGVLFPGLISSHLNDLIIEVKIRLKEPELDPGEFVGLPVECFPLMSGLYDNCVEHHYLCARQWFCWVWWNRKYELCAEHQIDGQDRTINLEWGFVHPWSPGLLILGQSWIPSSSIHPCGQRWAISPAGNFIWNILSLMLTSLSICLFHRRQGGKLYTTGKARWQKKVSQRPHMPVVLPVGKWEQKTGKPRTQDVMYQKKNTLAVWPRLVQEENLPVEFSPRHTPEVAFSGVSSVVQTCWEQSPGVISEKGCLMSSQIPELLLNVWSERLEQMWMPLQGMLLGAWAHSRSWFLVGRHVMHEVTSEQQFHWFLADTGGTMSDQMRGGEVSQGMPSDNATRVLYPHLAMPEAPTQQKNMQTGK